ncbi:MAG: glycosyltransferase family 2 protein [Anaerolineae bacterium]|nr:glycosyltransferase family 2 protein [Anaerolineae bacterium]
MVIEQCVYCSKEIGYSIMVLEKPFVNDWPFVTVIMPIRNEAAFVNRSLSAVLAQNYPQDRMEIIVADGMSTDGTREVVRSLQAQIPNLLLIDNPGKIVPAGLNAAIQQAKGEIIIRVDGHCEIGRDYVHRCVEHLRHGGVDGVGGIMETVGETVLAQVIAVAMSSPFGVGGSNFRTVRDKTRLVDTVAFPAYTRAVIERAGPFDEELVRNQDDEYNYRLRKFGAKILLAANIYSRYYSRSSLSSLWRQYFQYGFWKVRVMQKHARQMQPRQFVPSTFVITLFMAVALAFFFPLGQVLLALVVGTYLLGNLAASIWTVRKSNWRHLLSLPIIFTTLHLSYGMGFVVGLIKFWNRWGDRRTYTSTRPSVSLAIDAEISKH